MDPKYDVFLSHSHTDAEQVEALAGRLEDEVGLRVWLDKWVLVPGDAWQSDMAQGLQQSNTCAICIGKGDTKGWFRQEKQSALNGGAGDESFRVIPVLLPGSDSEMVNEFLELRTWVDFRSGLDDEHAFHRLVSGIKGEAPGRGPEARQEPFSPKGVLPDPGNLPIGSRLPFHRNAVFTGREEDLLSLADCLLYRAAGQDVVVTGTRAVATGFGGIGKSQLAVEFCYRYGRYFQGVHWLQADQDINAEMAACGAKMQLTPWPEDELPIQVDLTLQAWSRGSSRLVIFDNAEDPKDIHKWLSKLGNCRLLLTSRRGSWPAAMGLQLYPLNTLPRGESLTLLRKLAKRLEKTPDDELARIADRLGDHPLALTEAGRYLERRRRLSVDGYLRELEKAGNALDHASLSRIKGYNATEHETNLAATFALNWDELKDELAQQIFKLCGYCAPNAEIPISLLAAASEADQADIDEALIALEDLGLVHAGETGPSLHPLLTEFACLQDPEQACMPDLVETLGKMADEANQTGLPEQFKPLRAHVRAVAEAAEKAGLEDAGRLSNELGYHLHAVAEYAGARAAYERALAIDEASFGPEHPNVAAGVNNLGSVLQDLGDLDGARAAYERALAIDEASLGPEHPTVAIRVNNLGMVLHDLGELDGARAAFERALAIDEASFGPEHPNVAAGVNNLGSVLQDLGDLDGARAAYERALAIFEEALGPEHPQVATGVNNLGMVLHDLGELDGARAAFERALAIDEASFGPEHPNVAAGVNNLGSVLQDLGDQDGARAAYERALAIFEEALGPEHPQVATGVNNLGLVMKEQGDLEGARAAFGRALAIDEASLGPEHPNVAIRVNNLGMVMKDLGDLDGAWAAYERALAIDEANFGPEHPNVARDVNNLGSVLQDLGDLDGARAAYERSLAINRKFLPEDHWKIKATERSLANLGEGQK